jgi:hypothetical protein
MSKMNRSVKCYFCLENEATSSLVLMMVMVAGIDILFRFQILRTSELAKI